MERKEGIDNDSDSGRDNHTKLLKAESLVRSITTKKRQNINNQELFPERH